MSDEVVWYIGGFLSALVVVWMWPRPSEIKQAVALIDHDVTEAAKTQGHPRSPQWPTVRKKFLAGKVCAACGKDDALEAHHVKPFAQHPDLELQELNLIPLCEHPSRTCHWHFGHNALEWASCNPHVRDDAAQFLERRKHAV
jgi:hypothetical protein